MEHIAACIVVHNILLEAGDVWDEDNEDDADVPEDVPEDVPIRGERGMDRAEGLHIPPQDNQALQNEGKIRRDHMMNTVWEYGHA